MFFEKYLPDAIWSHSVLFVVIIATFAPKAAYANISHITIDHESLLVKSSSKTLVIQNSGHYKPCQISSINRAS